MNTYASLDGMLNSFRHNKEIVSEVVARGQAGREHHAFNPRRKTSGQEFLWRHVEVATYAPGASAHLELMLEMIKDNAVDGASTPLTMLQVD